MGGRLSKVRGWHTWVSLVSRCGLRGKACPESLLSVFLRDNAFLVDMWAFSIILLPKWSQEPSHRPWIQTPLESPSTGAAFYILAGLPSQGTISLGASMGTAQLHLYSCKQLGLLAPLVFCSSNIPARFLSLPCLLVPWNTVGKGRGQLCLFVTSAIFFLLLFCG